MHIDEPKLELLQAQPARPQVKSQARVKYSKTMDAPHRPRRRAPNARPDKPTKSWRERVAIQAIICAGFLAVLLAFNIIDTAFTNNVTSWVEQNLAFDFLAGEDGVGAWTSRVVDIFRTEDAPAIDHADDAPHHSPLQNIPEGTLTPEDSWIDPNILDEIETDGLD